jgi:hypothetical protein
MFDLFRSLGDVADRTRTLDTVARWLVRDLVERGGQTSPSELTDAAFAVLHPELGGRRIERGETALIADYQRIRRELVDPILTGGTTPVVLGGPKIPPGYTPHSNGLSRYSKERLETKLRALRAQGRLAITDDELDTFQRIAEVETSGKTQGLNTWDSAVVSIGWFQLTLQHDKLQRLIASAPAAFKRYDIELDPKREYTFVTKKRRWSVRAIKGVSNRDDLRWNGWADRFYRAGLDDDVIVAQVADGRGILAAGLRSAEKGYLAPIKGGYVLFKAAYDRSLPLRGLYQEALNNKPVGGRDGLILATKRALAEGTTDATRFYEIAKRAILETFVAMNDRKSGEGIVNKTASGALGY